MTPNRLRTLATLALMTLLGAVCADIVVHTIASQMVVAPPAMVKPTNSPAATASNHPLDDRQTVFLTAPLMAPPPSAIPDAIPTTAAGVASSSPWDQWLQDPQRSLTLIGTLVGDEVGIAVVSANGQQYAIKTGEALGAWRVADVEDTDVSFENPAHQRTRLVLPMLASSPSPVAMANAPGMPVVAPRVPLGPAIHPMKRGDTIVLQRPEVNAVISEPGALMRGVRFDAIAKDGKPYGVVVNYLEPTNLFSSLGLQQGDVLTGINDKDLRTQDDAIQAYLMLKNENALNMKLERGGQSVNIPVEIQ